MQNPQENKNFFDLDRIIIKKNEEMNKLVEEVSEKNLEIEILDEQIQELYLKNKKKHSEIENLDQIVRQKDGELEELNHLVNLKNYEIIELKDKIAQIQNSIIFKFVKSFVKKIDYYFPNNSKRGEFKKIVIASVLLIQRDGLKRYLSAIKNKIKKRELKILDITHSLDSYLPISISEDDKLTLINTVKNNTENRLKIKPFSKSELKKDEFIISDDNKLT